MLGLGLVVAALACGGGEPVPVEQTVAATGEATAEATPEPTARPESAAGESASPAATVDPDDIRYVREICLAGAAFDRAAGEFEERLGLDAETGEGADDLSEDQIAELVAGLLTGPMTDLGTALRAITPPPDLQEFSRGCGGRVDRADRDPRRPHRAGGRR